MTWLDYEPPQPPKRDFMAIAVGRFTAGLADHADDLRAPFGKITVNDPAAEPSGSVLTLSRTIIDS